MPPVTRSQVWLDVQDPDDPAKTLRIHGRSEVDRWLLERCGSERMFTECRGGTKWMVTKDGHVYHLDEVDAHCESLKDFYGPNLHLEVVKASPHAYEMHGSFKDIPLELGEQLFSGRSKSEVTVSHLPAEVHEATEGGAKPHCVIA